MEITTISKVASLVISSVMIQTAVAGHDVGIGVGPRFGGGGFGGGIFEMFFGGGGLHQTDRGNTSRGHFCSARGVHHRSTSARRCWTLHLSQKTSIFRSRSKRRERRARCPPQSRRGSRFCLEWSNADFAQHSFPSLKCIRYSIDSYDNENL